MLTPTQRQQFVDEGYFLTDVVFDAPTMTALRAEFDRLWQEEIDKHADADQKTQDLVRLRPFIAHVHTRSQFCADFCRGPVFRELCSELIGPDADLYFNQAVMKPPGKGKSFAWHQDTQYVVTNPLEYVTCWLAVADATVENGTIWIVPGMHKHGLLPHVMDEANHEWVCQFDDSMKIPVELAAGRMAVFNSLLPHCSGPNVSQTTRYAYVPQFHVAGVTLQESGDLTGDQFPVLRHGEPVKA